MRATPRTGKPSPLRRSRWPGPSVREMRQEKGPARAGPFFVLLSFVLTRLAACRPPARAGLARRRRAAGGAAALGRRALLRGAPLLLGAAALRGAALGRAPLPRRRLSLWCPALARRRL